jgi:tetratricopeptide (TPR) repeat protein
MGRNRHFGAVFLLFFCFFPTVSAVQAESEDLAQTDLSAYKSSKHTGKWDKQVTEGIQAFHDEDYDLTLKLHDKAFNLGCKSPIVLFQLALIHEDKESYHSALEFYKLAKKEFASANKDHRYALTFDENYARALFLSGKPEEAMPLLQKSAKKSKSFWLLKMLGMMAYDKGDTLNATAYFERAVRLPAATQSELVYIYGLLAKMFLEKGEQDGAIRYYNKVLELDPQNSAAKTYVDGLNKIYQRKTPGLSEEQLKEFKEMVE